MIEVGLAAVKAVHDWLKPTSHTEHSPFLIGKAHGMVKESKVTGNISYEEIAKNWP